MRGKEPVLLRFGRFELDLVREELRKDGARVRLQPQPFKLLALLARRSGDLVTREELRRALWGEHTFVDFEQGLGFCVRQVRSALGDAARSPLYLETLPRRGFRFLAPVRTPATAPPGLAARLLRWAGALFPRGPKLL